MHIMKYYFTTTFLKNVNTYFKRCAIYSAYNFVEMPGLLMCLKTMNFHGLRTHMEVTNDNSLEVQNRTYTTIIFDSNIVFNVVTCCHTFSSVF